MDLINELKKNGHRITKARIAICDILETSGHFHMTAEEIFSMAKKQSNIKIDRATVYRTLDSLEELNLITHAHQPHESGYYFLNKDNLNTHITCKNCNDIVDVSKKSQKNIIKTIEDETGFKLIDSNYMLRGYCKNCT